LTRHDAGNRNDDPRSMAVPWRRRRPVSSAIRFGAYWLGFSVLFVVLQLVTLL